MTCPGSNLATQALPSPPSFPFLFRSSASLAGQPVRSFCERWDLFNTMPYVRGGSKVCWCEVAVCSNSNYSQSGFPPHNSYTCLQQAPDTITPYICSTSSLLMPCPPSSPWTMPLHTAWIPTTLHTTWHHCTTWGLILRSGLQLLVHKCYHHLHCNCNSYCEHNRL